VTNEDWERSLAEKPFDADLRRVHADWLEDQNAPAEQIAEARRTAETLAKLLGLEQIRPEEDRKRSDGALVVADDQTGLRYAFNPQSGYVRRYTRVKRRFYNHVTRQHEERAEWRSEAINPPYRKGEPRVAGDPLTMRKVYSLAEQIDIVLRAIERARKKLARKSDTATTT
jgi:hypothetical protein